MWRWSLLLLLAGLGCQSTSAIRHWAARPSGLSGPLPAPIANSRQEYADLEDRFKSELLEHPADAQLHAQLGYVQYAQGKYASARQSLAKAVELAPDWPAVRLRYAYALYSQGEHAEAGQHCQWIVKDDANVADAHALLGRIHRQAGQNQQAQTAYLSAWNCTPRSLDAGVELADFDRARQDDSSAIDRLRVCLAAEPTFHPARRRLAQILVDRGLIDDAVAHYQMLIQAGVGDARLHQELAQLYERQRQPTLADEHRQQALRLQADPQAEDAIP